MRERHSSRPWRSGTMMILRPLRAASASGLKHIVLPPVASHRYCGA